MEVDEAATESAVVSRVWMNGRRSLCKALAV